MGIRRLSAYAAIYLLWGGSFLAIRYVVGVIPPFFAAGIRYSLGGLVLIAFSLAFRRRPLPSVRQAINAAATGVVLLTISYGTVYWAETRLSSWVVAVLVSTVFLWTYLGECLVLRLEPLRAVMLLPLLAGLIGMPLLLNATFVRGQRTSLAAGVAVLIGAGLTATTMLAIKRIDLPVSTVQTAALQLSSSGLAFFCVAFLVGELSRMPMVDGILRPRPFFAMAYLVVGGSVLAFTAFQWLLIHESATLVATSSYVNPIVAMLLGIPIAHERLGRMQLLGALLILGSILVIWYARMPAVTAANANADREPLPACEMEDALAAAAMKEPCSVRR